jgi:hypothetical protein
MDKEGEGAEEEEEDGEAGGRDRDDDEEDDDEKDGLGDASVREAGEEGREGTCEFRLGEEEIDLEADKASDRCARADARGSSSARGSS